jgi:hypothetical protein
MGKIVTKRNIVILFICIILLGSFVSIRSTYAKFTNDYTTEDNVAEFNYDFNLSLSNIEEYEIVKVSPGDYTIFNVQVYNDTSDNISYGIWYKLFAGSSDIVIAKYSESENNTSGELDSKESKIVTLIAINSSSSVQKIKIGVASTDKDVNAIEYLGGKKLVSGVREKPNLEANSPNLDSGIIPVLYDDENDNWVTADKENANKSWYDYDSGKWANGILVTDSTRSKYLDAKVGTIINMSDVLAFYVWIPRFKYRVWNVSRNLTGEDNYSYKAYSEGIDIKWENGIENTGNFSCSYDKKADDLADKCIYNGINVISSKDDNKDYSNVWYTHPAFTFGDKEITGFWIGKFETTGTNDNPTILPDNKALTNSNMSTQFTISKMFQEYGLTSNIDAHMLKNIEWGAVSYLTHSNYGLCKNSSCRDVYINNSSNLYTGRSGGDIAGSDNLIISKLYTNVINSQVKYSSTGYYNYQGYLFDYQGKLTTVKNVNKVASTTGNIYGVYDLVGGASENILGNSSISSNAFNIGGAGGTWSVNSSLASKYYDSYSYAKDSSSDNLWTRSIMGDATSENIVLINNKAFAWKGGFSISGSISNVNYFNYPWLTRGGKYSDDGASIFSFNNYNGSANEENTFRSVLS